MMLNHRSISLIVVFLLAYQVYARNSNFDVRKINIVSKNDMVIQFDDDAGGGADDDDSSDDDSSDDSSDENGLDDTGDYYSSGTAVTSVSPYYRYLIISILLHNTEINLLTSSQCYLNATYAYIDELSNSALQIIKEIKLLSQNTTIKTFANASLSLFNKLKNITNTIEQIYIYQISSAYTIFKFSSCMLTVLLINILML